MKKTKKQKKRKERVTERNKCKVLQLNLPKKNTKNYPAKGKEVEIKRGILRYILHTQMESKNITDAVFLWEMVIFLKRNVAGHGDY